jgi:hypothetical protein
VADVKTLADKAGSPLIRILEKRSYENPDDNTPDIIVFMILFKNVEDALGFEEAVDNKIAL